MKSKYKVNTTMMRGAVSKVLKINWSKFFSSKVCQENLDYFKVKDIH
jgi:hypothetical protein